MTNTCILAYLAGAMDSDGYFTIKRSTYHRRVRMDAVNATYSEKIGLHQITTHITELLHETFGGHMYLGKPQTENSKPMYRWTATDLNAANACRLLLPYLRVKREQAEVLIELRESKASKYEQSAYWFALEHPDWSHLPLMTYPEVAEALGYTGNDQVKQAVKNGTLLALPYTMRGFAPEPRIPRLLVERVKAHKTVRGHRRQADELIAWKEHLWERVRFLNTVGVNGTPVNHRTGPFMPKE